MAEQRTKGFLAAQPLSDADIAEIASKPDLDVGDFCRITESAITSDHDREEAIYIISQDVVRYRPVSDHLLSQLFPGELDEVLEQMRHALSFPCSPAEIVAFVKATDHCFSLPEGFAEAVADGQPEAIDTRGMVAWQAVMLARWKEIEAAGKNNGRGAVSWLKKNDTSGVFDKSCTLRDKFTWIDSEKQKHETPIKTVQTRISVWRKKGIIPAKTK